MTKIVHIIIGAIGTGKSRLAGILSDFYNIEILSADEIENACNVSRESDIDGEIVEQYFSFLDQNKSFILDGANLSISSRELYIKHAHNMGYNVYVYDLGAGDNNSLERRLKDNRGVSSHRWKEVALSNKSDYQKPMVLQENIDKLYTLY